MWTNREGMCHKTSARAMSHKSAARPKWRSYALCSISST